MPLSVTVDHLPENELAILRPSALPMGVRFSSGTKKANLVFQYDGNLVVYDENGTARFATNTADDECDGHGGRTCVFQDDGNLVVYGDNHKALWKRSHTADSEKGGHGGRSLRVQKDGNVVIYDADDKPIWASWDHPI
jgi:hypothetical protein